MAKSTDDAAWKAALPGAAAAIGILLVAVGIMLPAMSNPASAVTEKDAVEYYEASSAIEHAAANQARRNRQGEIPSNSDQAREFQAARDRFSAAKEKLALAKEGNEAFAWWMKIGGFAFVAIGVAGLLMQKSNA